MRSRAQEVLAMRTALLVAPLFASLFLGCMGTPEGGTDSESHRASRVIPHPTLQVKLRPETVKTIAAYAGAGVDAPAKEGSPASPSGKRLVAYWASWTASALPVAKIDWSKVTHVAHAFVLPSSSGGLTGVASYANAELVAAAHAHGVKVLASVGGWGANFDANVGAAARSKTVAALASLCKTHGYDGVDIDWEYPTAATAAGWGALVTELRAALDAIDAKLTISAAVSGAPANLAVLPKKGVEALSWMGVMTYDYAGPWSASTGHHAPLHDSVGGDGGSTASAIDYITDTLGVPPSKVLFGLPFYGYQFAANGLDESPVAPSKGLDYNVIAPLVGTGGWKRTFDGAAGVPYLSRPASPGFVTYEDAASVNGKCTWAQGAGLGGAIVWHLAGDRMPDGTQPLLAAAQACR
jgi:chitinase